VRPRLPSALHDAHSSADDGYRLTYGGYDFLAIRAFAKRNTVHAVGNQIGTGKESGMRHCWIRLGPR
jgi:RIO-like serine/threonine protein kinase